MVLYVIHHIEINMIFTKPDAIGVGIQYNPEILDWFPFEELQVDLYEILVDNIMAPLDGPQIIKPSARKTIERLRSKCPLIAHSNYGCDFGFSPLEQTAAARRHIALSHMIGSPWVANHCFYGDESWLDSWSSPVQFSREEVERCALRAHHLQEMYGRPLAHENAAYYLPCPGAEMREAEFMARLVERSGTFLHLDLHNIYTNSINLPGYDLKDYLNTIPLDRVIAVHLAGGSWFGGLYHDWHDASIPEPVWDLYEEILQRASPSAIILEYQGQAHHPDTRILGKTEDADMIYEDLAQAKALWHRYRGAPSSLPTQKNQSPSGEEIA
ncbi:MbnB/TglH/ChrH family RiPP precursor modification enzyme [Azotobacter armeniacus]